MTLDDLTTPLTEDQVKALLYAEIVARGGSPTSWKPGGWMRTLVAVFAAAIAGLTELAAAVTKGGFLELATGPWLTLVARYVYAVERDVGSFASGNVTFVNSTGAVYSGSASDLIVRNPISGKTYRNTAPYSIGSGATVDIPFSAIEIGAASTSAPGTITQLVTTLNGVTVSNGAPLVGLDEERDDALKLRCYEKTGSLSPNGPRDAYAFVARSAKLNGVSVGVTRVRTIADGAGGVDVYVADASGQLLGATGDLSTPLGVVDDAIQRYCAPLAVTARTHSATAHSIPVTYELWLRRTSLDDATIQDAVRDQLTSWMATRPIGGHDIGAGGKVFVKAIESVIGSTEGLDGVINVAVTLPAADVAITSTEAPVLGTITPTAIHQVDEDVI
jgi:phage-related baseplate assembly protein